MTGPKVVGLGGGHGLAATLTAARRYAGAITAVVSVADDGGSSGRLRRDFGIPAPGDVRRCLIALASDPGSPFAKTFGHRFDAGDLAGHAVGNLILAGLAETMGSFEEAIAEAGRQLQTVGDVLPATEGPVRLVGLTARRPLVGQTAVEASAEPIIEVGIDPPDARAPEAVTRAIQDADQVVLGPGSLFTSVLAVTTVPMIREALNARKSGVVYICNLKASGETPGYDAAAHVATLLNHGVTPDAVLVDPAAIPVGDVPKGIEIVEAPLARPGGWLHDVERLARSLESLVR